jgi:hypothetical protein
MRLGALLPFLPQPTLQWQAGLAILSIAWQFSMDAGGKLISYMYVPVLVDKF